jgi:plasmid maintenance system killer protein
VILRFACAETERLFHAESSRWFPPGNRLEALKGDLKGRHSIRVNDQWRICFSWSEGNAYEVEIMDYH